MPVSIHPRSFAILPAAGRSVRMGRPKLRLAWRDGVVLDAVLQSWCASSATHVVVVLHPDDADLTVQCRRYGADAVVPDVAPPEMKVSVMRGLEYVWREYDPKASDAWLVAPADMPRLSTAAIETVIADWRKSADPQAGGATIRIAVSGGKRGHPVLFPWQLAMKVAGLGPDEGLNRLVATHPVREVPTAEPGVLCDIDTPNEYEDARRDAQA